jgi:archaetidylinositol phosphate synthase
MHVRLNAPHPEPVRAEGRNSGFRDAKRVQEGISAAAERRVLLWLAQRTPRRINSDHLTLLGFAAMLGAGVCYALAARHPWTLWLVVFCLLLNWLGDSLDGTLARFRNRQRPRYGFYVDHIVDSFSATFLLGGLALSGYMSPAIAAGLLVAFLLLSINSYLAAYSLRVFQISFLRMGPTEARILLAIGTVALLYRPYTGILGRPLLLFDFGGAIAMVGMLLLLAFSVVANTRALYREERLQ